MKAGWAWAAGLCFLAWVGCAEDEGESNSAPNQGSNSADNSDPNNASQNSDPNNLNNTNNSNTNNPNNLNNINNSNNTNTPNNPNNSNNINNENNTNHENNSNSNTNNINNSSNHDNPLPPCEAGTLLILEPRADAVIAARDDSDAGEPGVQVNVRVATSAPSGTFLTVENLATGQSAGAVVEGPEVVVRGVSLVEGLNRLVAFADAPTCFAQSSELQVTLEAGPTACEDDAGCGFGLRCEGGACEACEAACEEDAQCGAGAQCARGCCEALARAYRFVLVEDTTPAVSGESPGADVDAISVSRGQVERFATNVEDFSFPGANNRFNDPNALLGPSDSGCQVRNFASLGGAQLGGYVVVSFHTDDEDVTIQAGDRVKVYEVGQTLCGQFDDDPYEVSVSATSDTGTFITLGRSAVGVNQFTVPELP